MSTKKTSKAAKTANKGNATIVAMLGVNWQDLNHRCAWSPDRGLTRGLLDAKGNNFVRYPLACLGVQAGDTVIFALPTGAGYTARQMLFAFYQDPKAFARRVHNCDDLLGDKRTRKVKDFCRGVEDVLVKEALLADNLAGKAILAGTVKSVVSQEDGISEVNIGDVHAIAPFFIPGGHFEFAGINTPDAAKVALPKKKFGQELARRMDAAAGSDAFEVEIETVMAEELASTPLAA